MRLPLPLLASALLGGTLLTGCIPVVMRSTVDSASRANVPENQPTTIQAGTSRRADVLLELGEPDGRAADESWYTYALTRTSGVGGFLLIGGGGAVGVVGGVAGSQDMTRIVVHFDPIGNVTSVEPQHLHCKHYIGGIGNAGGESKPCVSPTGEDLKTEVAVAARTDTIAAGTDTPRGNPDGTLVVIRTEEIPEFAAGPVEVPLQVTDRRTKSKTAFTAMGISGRSIELDPGEMQLVRTVVQSGLDGAIGARADSGAPPEVTCELVDFSITASYAVLYWDVSARVEWVVHVGEQQRTVIAQSKQRTLIPANDVLEAVVVKALKQAQADTRRAATDEFAAALDHGGA